MGSAVTTAIERRWSVGGAAPSHVRPLRAFLILAGTAVAVTALGATLARAGSDAEASEPLGR